jgi:hypothetical protein
LVSGLFEGSRINWLVGYRVTSIPPQRRGNPAIVAFAAAATQRGAAQHLLQRHCIV